MGAVPMAILGIARIRLERSEDAAAIRRVTRAAFEGVAYSDQTEAAIIEALRADGALTLSLVAVEAENVVGHAAFSPVCIDGVAGGWFGLGPISVAPERQGGGIGSALIREGLQALRARGAEGCVVLGNPAYYGRFGFETDPALRYGHAPPAHFQRLVLHGSAPRGVVGYHPSFEAP